MARARPIRTAGVAALTAALLVAGCTGDDDSVGPTSTATSSPDSTPAAPDDEPTASAPEPTVDGDQLVGDDQLVGRDQLVDRYRRGLASGVWADRTEAVTAILADTADGSTTGISGFLSAAGELLADDTTRRPERLAELVDELSPSPERLAELVTSTAEAMPDADGVRRIGAIRRVGALVGCDDTTEPGPGPLTVCLLEVDVEIESTFLTIYVPAALARADRGAIDGIVDELTGTTATVLAPLPLRPQRALPPEIVMLVDPRPQPGFTTSGRRVDDVCHITMTLGTVTAASASLLDRSLAGEIFRCYQQWNFDTSGYPANAAWVEGTASWFEHHVFGVERSDDFAAVERGASLIDLSHQNDIFFIDYEQHGTLSVDEFMALMRSGDRSMQIDAWGAVPGIADDFHAFAERYLNGTIRWTGVDDDADDDIVLRAEIGALTLGPPEPFRIHRARIELGDDAGYDQRIDADIDTTVTYQSPRFSAWRRPPTEVLACPQTDVARLLYTTVRSDQRALAIAFDDVRDLDADCTTVTTEPPPG